MLLAVNTVYSETHRRQETHAHKYNGVIDLLITDSRRTVYTRTMYACMYVCVCMQVCVHTMADWREKRGKQGGVREAVITNCHRHLLMAHLKRMTHIYMYVWYLNTHMHTHLVIYIQAQML